MSASLDLNAKKLMQLTCYPTEIAPNRWVEHWITAVDRSVQIQRRSPVSNSPELMDIESVQVVGGFGWKSH